MRRVTCPDCQVQWLSSGEGEPVPCWLCGAVPEYLTWTDERMTEMLNRVLQRLLEEN